MADSRKRRPAQRKSSTYGSMAYKLDYYSDVVAVPQPRVAPMPRTAPKAQPKADPQVTTRVRERSRVRVTTRQQQAVAPFAIIGFLAAAAIAVVLLLGNIQLNSLYADNVQLQKQLTTLKTEHADLTAQFELKFDQAKLEAAVAADGTLAKPNSNQSVYIDLSEPDNAVVYGSEKQSTGVDGFFKTVGDLFSSVVEYFR
ncbi:MAG: hypothetical protein SOW00_01480 [Oscillospiraceae bacterium]|nr:hypothetical protein [Eubacteriales bacterium]MDY2617452.1 hypothetical protein [Oscillospiraceae bacterium]